MTWGLLALSGLGSAAGHGRLSSQVALEAWDSETTPAHGLVMVAYDGFMPTGWRWAAEFNTDTIRLEIDGLRVTSTTVFGSRLTGELGSAQLLNDYFIDGEADPSRGVRTSYVRGQVWTQTQWAERWFLMSEIGVRQWFATATDETDEDYTLPDNTVVIEPRIRLMYWALRADSGYGDRFRLFTRDRGLAFGVHIAPNWQLNTGTWGAVNPDVFDPVDPRNDPQSFQLSVNQWLKAGTDLSQTLRVQFTQEAQRQSGTDDRYRRTIGGLMPYVVSVPGVPWAYFHSSDYFGGSASVHWAMTQVMELGPVFGAVALRDVNRVGDDAFSMVWGAGLALDWRWSQWQLDVRGGFSPGLVDHHPKQAGWSGLISLGYVRNVL